MAAPHDDPGSPSDDGDRASDEELTRRWAEIVAELRDSGPALDPSATSDTADPASRVGPAVTYPVAPWVAAAAEERTSRELSGRDWEGTDQIDAAEAEVDDLEHFVPPDPGPVFGGDPLLTMAWVGAAGIPIALLIMVVAWRTAPTILLQVAGVVFALSCALLVWRLPHHRDDTDHDSGAVV